MPPQAGSDIDNKAASDNAADDNGRTCRDFSLNVFDGCGLRGASAIDLRNARGQRAGPGGSEPASIGRARDMSVTAR
ncbi:exported protein of unknown function [Ralstonia solanacearum CFBP2957]|nr:exported protein of unknown function [Ralstonia solanacearum CFBP2957]